MQVALGWCRPSYALRSIRSARFTWRSMSTAQQTSAVDQSQDFNFGPLRIPSSQVFAVTQSSFALVNLKPLVPGHVLISPRRVAPRLRDLSAEEVADLWQLAQAVATCMETEFKADALTLAIQDGPAAGQTIPHVHIHCVPRHFKDLERNDEIYDRIDDAEEQELASRQRQPLGNVDSERTARSAEEMASEAARFRELMSRSTS